MPYTSSSRSIAHHITHLMARRVNPSWQEAVTAAQRVLSGPRASSSFRQRRTVSSETLWPIKAQMPHILRLIFYLIVMGREIIQVYNETKVSNLKEHCNML